MFCGLGNVWMLDRTDQEVVGGNRLEDGKKLLRWLGELSVRCLTSSGLREESATIATLS